jgi:exodeoxyribonuclease III
VRVATWNVDSAKQRLPRLLPWLDERQPDVVCLQKTKLVSAAFDELLAGGYAVARHEEAQWNGVAILSRSGLEEVTVGIPAFRGPPSGGPSAVGGAVAASASTRFTFPTGGSPTPSCC